MVIVIRPGKFDIGKSIFQAHFSSGIQIRERNRFVIENYKYKLRDLSIAFKLLDGLFRLLNALVGMP